MIDYKATGKRIKTLRCLYKMTQSDMAKKINISVNYLNKIENGSVASINTFLNISKILDTTVSYIVLGDITESKNILINRIFELLTDL